MKICIYFKERLLTKVSLTVKSGNMNDSAVCVLPIEREAVNLGKGEHTIGAYVRAPNLFKGLSDA